MERKRVRRQGERFIAWFKNSTGPKIAHSIIVFSSFAFAPCFYFYSLSLSLSITPLHICLLLFLLLPLLFPFFSSLLFFSSFYSFFFVFILVCLQDRSQAFVSKALAQALDVCGRLEELRSVWEATLHDLVAETVQNLAANDPTTLEERLAAL